MTKADVDSLKAERDRFVALAFCWGDLLFEVDRDFLVVFCAGATEAFLGRRTADLTGVPLRDVVAPADMPLVGQILKKMARLGRIDREVVRLRTPHGGLLAMSLAGYVLDDTAGHYYLALRMGTVEAAAAASLFNRTAGGLYDATTFADMASQRLKRLEQDGETAELTFVDLPGLDSLGQRLDEETRRRLLSDVGTRLRAESVGGDSATEVSEGRYGLLHAAGADIAGLSQAIEVLARQADPAGQGVAVAVESVPMGALTNISQEDLAHGLIYAMNRFREAEGQGFSLHSLSQSMERLVASAVREVNDFRSLVALSRFDIAVQPIIDLKTGDIHHFEALCRFPPPSPESPFGYITFAEETGLIQEFDLAMVHKAVRWLEKMPRNNDKFRLAVNVSGHSVGVASYVEPLHALLAAHPWTQGRLMFEITESARMTDLDRANAFIQGLRSKGYPVCLDDFGAGAASFQYLSVLEVDIVKLDGSAINNAHGAAKGRAFLTALTELCRRLGVKTVAEMVDHPTTLMFVRDCGCDFVQGYLFGKPSRSVGDFSTLPMGYLLRGTRAAKARGK